MAARLMCALGSLRWVLLGLGLRTLCVHVCVHMCVCVCVCVCYPIHRQVVCVSRCESVFPVSDDTTAPVHRI